MTTTLEQIELMVGVEIPSMDANREKNPLTEIPFRASKAPARRNAEADLSPWQLIDRRYSRAFVLGIKNRFCIEIGPIKLAQTLRPIGRLAISVSRLESVRDARVISRSEYLAQHKKFLK